ncbi:hypothetical protein ACTFIR_006930 [Dictyostelium discoideum]
MSDQNILKCKKCQLEITNKIITNHNSDTFHEQCFACKLCSTPISDPYFTDKETGDFYCAKCEVIRNDQSKPLRESLGFCSLCYKYFRQNEDILTIDLERYHIGCLKCTICKKGINNEKYYREKMTSKLSNYCCEDCFEKVDKCNGCNSMMLGQTLLAMGKNYHANCFKCFKCSEIIKPNSPYSINKQTNTPSCQKCN